ncbi:carboxymuconolactone decarboxylase family protein [Pseudoalteromonas sp. T1lg65]|uniref:carboxymuconolactone decarboxylase family protein n=1 Tax=Pseudoalteromonas sp. T1lg65 TaxID=2077101 RepID=UPI003F799FE2
MKRANHYNAAPALMRILITLEEQIESTLTPNVEFKAIELIKLRVSQLNQCGYCIEMHREKAQAAGESPQRLMGLSAWKTLPFYTQQEQTMLEFAERVTSAEVISEQLYQRLSEQFSDETLFALTVAINAINSWNRVVKVFQPEVNHS